MLGSDIKNFFRKNTKLVFLESPGSITFEVQDVPAICAEAKARGITTMIDNTWGTPIYFKPFEHGVDVSLHAGTKYINGHSDVMLGTATATREAFPALNQAANEFGQTTAPDDCYLALRGLRTLSVRLARHEKSALELAHWLQGREEVERVLHPALPSCPGHEFWKRDFLGSCGLFGVILKPATKKALAAMLDHMELFKMGYSWGGFESLILPHNPADIRTATKWQTKGPLLRLHAGLEDAQDLIRDLEKGFERLNQANG
jgi:cystathionine beta-lyase